MMRILHVYKDYPPVRGGIEHHIRSLATGQAARGHDVEVVVAATGSRSTTSMECGVRVLRAARLGTLRSTPLSPGLVMTAVRRPADIVHLHFPHPPGELAWILRAFRPPAVVSYHADIIRQKLLALALRPMRWVVLSRAARILVSSPMMMTSSSDVHRHAGRVSVVPMGIPEPLEVPADDRELLNIESRFPSPRVLFVGRLRHYKGVRHLIDAMADVAAVLLIAGDGPLRAELEARVAALGMGDRVRFLGDVEESTLWRLYQAADILVLPSDSRAESYGLVLVEAMAVGVPVISTELGTSTSWVNRHGETGLVVPPSDPSALAHSVRELLDDHELRSRLGRAARRRVRSELLADRMVDRVLEIYREILAPESSLGLER